MKALIHVGEKSQWNIAVGNTKNLKVIHPNANVIIVVNSVAVRIFETPSDELTEQLKILHDLNAVVKLCKNALNSNNIDEDNLPEFTEVVPAGIAEIVERQNEGYAYVSP
ncbi:MAG: hypothetical protein GXZ08_05070 [Tissierellia bacterium]|nr:hypothetical protein [Tissierellia bacterium]